MTHLRPFTRDDVPVIKNGQYPTLDEQEILSMIDEWSTKQYNGGYFEMLAVVDGGVIVGSVSLYSRHEGIVSHGVDIFPEHRRRGYGAAAVTLALEYAKSLGYKVVTAQVRKDNAASVALHAKLGFSLDHEYVNAKGNAVFFCIKPL